MATEQLLALLKQSVKGWNAWRYQYPDFEPDLSQAWFQDLIVHLPLR